jgi:HD-GYP domain-containing protein (c-di-GMP phosphodiesterase class II)
MSRSILKKITEKDDNRLLLEEVAASLGAWLSVEDHDGMTVFQAGDPGAGDPTEAMDVALARDPVGRVTASAHAGVFAAVLSHLAVQQQGFDEVLSAYDQKYQRLSFLFELAVRISACRSLDQVSQVLVAETSRLFPGDDVSIMLVDEHSYSLETPLKDAEQTNPDSPGMGARMARWILDTGSSQMVEEAAKYPDLCSGLDVGAAMAAPLKVKDRVIGVICVASPQPERYDYEHLQLLTSLAAEVAAPVENVRLYVKLRAILSRNEELNNLNDVDAILDKTLLEARKLANADAGSIFLVQDGRLTFSYVHNDSLFGQGQEKEVYTSFSIPVDETSIVGYVALTGKTLVIDDAYALPGDLPYSFNSSFDKKTGYRTTSLLTIPLKTFQDKLVGVMQLINAKDRQGYSVPFSEEAQIYIPVFANNAAVAIDRGIMTRETILRMMKMAQLRDPAETGAHVQRVGSYAAEIYQAWALRKGYGIDEIKHHKDAIRIGAMLHDVGKVGISDFILKKPGRLLQEEFEIMKLHTVYGGRLFANSTSGLDRICAEIAMHHHEKWGGNGYPGQVDDLAAEKADGHPLSGENIPIHARVAALADVYDALASKRCYKDPWPEEKTLAVIREESGRHFDPEVVEAFFDIYDVILAIREKYQDQAPELDIDLAG